MQKFFVIPIIIFFSISCHNNNSTIPPQETEILGTCAGDSSEYICGFANSYTSIIIQKSTKPSTIDDSIIEKTFYNLWTHVIGGDATTILIKKDLDQTKSNYKYAAATKIYSPLTGLPIRVVLYKTNDFTHDVISQLNGWVLKAIALHELGHHINYHTFSNDGKKEYNELKADDYAGFHLADAKINAPLDSIIMVYLSFTDLNSVNGYPNQLKRINALKEGWNRGHEAYPSSFVASIAGTMNVWHGAAQTKVFIDFSNILNGIQKNAIAKSEIPVVNSDTAKVLFYSKVNLKNVFIPCFIDSNFLYTEASGQIIPVGEIAESNKPGYTRMIYDKYYNYMYIDKNNLLVTYTKNIFNGNIRVDTVGSIEKKVFNK